MIIMKYDGGLGNQMFQCAAAITLAQKLGVEAKFDMSFFSKKYSRAYGMDIFGIEGNPVFDFRVILYWRLRRYRKFKNIFGLNIYAEKDNFCYDEEFEKIEDNTFIEGYFQSVKYFDEKLIRKTFEFKNPPTGLNAQAAEDIMHSNSVSVHIRRGDYVQKARYQKLFNELTLDYYKNAQKIIEEKVKNPVYYVFSDDISWVREHLGFKNAHYIEHNSGENSWEDMRLMSLCKHNIVANSSFSWWGAYLNSNSDKIVVGPKKWFNNEHMITKDVCPPDWVLL